MPSSTPSSRAPSVTATNPTSTSRTSSNGCPACTSPRSTPCCPPTGVPTPQPAPRNSRPLESLINKQSPAPGAPWSAYVYLSDGRIEIDNNLVENAIRPAKLGAKNWLFIGCREAGQRAAILYTIVENCRRLGIDTREYLEDVLTRLPRMTVSEAIHLTPANWLHSRQGRPRRKAA